MLCRELPPPARSRGELLRSAAGRRWPRRGAPLELVLRDGTRDPGRRRDDDRAGAGLDAAARRPHRLARARADLAAATARRRSRTPARATARSSTARGSTGPIALRDGARIRLGDQELIAVERRRDDAEAGRTIVVRARRARCPVPPAGGGAGRRRSSACTPRVRSGLRAQAPRRERGQPPLGAARPAVGQRSCACSDNDAAAVRAARRHATRWSSLIGTAEQRFGARGPARRRAAAGRPRRARLPGRRRRPREHGAPAAEEPAAPLFTPREKSCPGSGPCSSALPSTAAGCCSRARCCCRRDAHAPPGIAVFVLPVVRPLRDAVRGRRARSASAALVFLAGRFAFVAVHEAAHGLTMASFGRSVERAGFKLFFIFPYAFVDTSEAWFEPRRRRIAISAAGPGVRLHARRAVLDPCLVSPRPARRATSSSSSPSRPMSARSSTSTRSSTATATTSSSTSLREPGLQPPAKEQFERRLSGERAPRPTPRRCGATRCSGSLVRCSWAPCSRSA